MSLKLRSDLDREYETLLPLAMAIKPYYCYLERLALYIVHALSSMNNAAI